MASNEFVVTFEKGNVKSVVDATKSEDQHNHLEKFLLKFCDAVSIMGLKHVNESTVYSLCEELVHNVKQLLVDEINHVTEMGNFKHVASEIISRNLEYIKERFLERGSRFKRQKIISNDINYVAPLEKSIGLKWQVKVNSGAEMPSNNIVQSTFHYVPILSTLKQHFSTSASKDEYRKYNEAHTCVPNQYENFCCGTLFQNSQFFNENPGALQIQLAIDDFEICCGLKSKAKIHKICAIYFQIRNVPEKRRSKLQHIYLVALCNSEYLKRAGGFNSIGELIVREIKVLESNGIEIGEDKPLKGTLVHLSADNLGANGVLGFSESFNSIYFCRQCEASKDECQQLEGEVFSQIRQKSFYEKCMQSLQGAESKDLKKTKGYKKQCCLNSLEFYHMLDNWTIDLMHDVKEGVIPFLLNVLFEYWIKRKFLSYDDIQRRIRDYNYGILNKRNKPSLLLLTKKNLNQNATQLYCIMVHLPFIFADVKDKMGTEWQTVDSLLNCMQIIFSRKISDRDVTKLRLHIEKHLNGIKSIFGKTLIPKHHFLCHYPSFILNMGPPIHCWMLRYEGKHQVFTNAARSTNNFQNITKTLAVRHQEHLYFNSTPETDTMPSKTSSRFTPENVFVEQSINNYFGANASSAITEYKHLAVDNTVIKPGLFVIVNKNLFEIAAIVAVKNEFFFVCSPYDILNYNDFFKSVEISKNEEHHEKSIWRLNEINNRVLEKRSYNNSFYIIIESVDVFELN